MKKLIKKVNVLGTQYKIYSGNSIDFPLLRDCGGYCDQSIKKIVVNNTDDDKGRIDMHENMAATTARITRHELIHALVYESGLAANSWAANEEIIDWIAHQYPKMKIMFEAAGCE